MAGMGDHVAALEASLAVAVARGGDPQGEVYARLFARHPAMEAEFWRDGSGRIRGEMLMRSIEACLDLAAPHAPAGGWAAAFLATEAVTHAAYGIDRAVFADFLPIIAGQVAAACGDEFTPAMAAAWALVLDRAGVVLGAVPGAAPA